MDSNSMFLNEDEEFFDTMRIMEELSNGTMEKKFNDISDYMREVYLRDQKEWMLMFSSGKDSSLVLDRTIDMLEKLPPELRTKTVHVISADTKVETKKMTSFLKKNLELIEQNCSHLNIKVHYVRPNLKNSYFWNVIGRGVVPPRPPNFRAWCQNKLKAQPMNAKIEDIISNTPVSLDFSFIDDSKHDVYMLIGSRLEESHRRAKSIEKYSDSEDEMFGHHRDYDNIRVFYPIKFIGQTDLWAHLTRNPELPWGLKSMELLEMYSDNSKECPMTSTSENAMSETCGTSNSRNGCWTCLYAGRKDRMLEQLMSNGHVEVQYLAQWKAYLFDVLYDVRFREPLRRHIIKRHDKELKKNKKADFGFDLFDIHSSEDKIHYTNYKRASHTAYEPGGFTFEMRLKLLQKLLYAQENVGYELIESEELNAILDSWAEEGYSFSPSDIAPINHEYDGALVLNPNGKINEKATETSNPVFYVSTEFKLEEDELVEYIKERQRVTGKSYYCNFNHRDFSNFEAVHNVLEFVVCETGIENEAKAKERIHQWLFVDSKETIEDSFPKMTKQGFQAALDYILLSNLQDSLNDLNQVEHQMHLNF